MLTITCVQEKYLPCYGKKVDGITVLSTDYIQVLARWFSSVAGPEEWFAACDAMFGNKNGAAANNPAEPAKAGDSI